mgnify:CR=1 FL=1
MEPAKKVGPLEAGLEWLIMSSRWLQAPLYVGLIVVLGVVVVAALVARRVLLDDSTHGVGTDSALDDYRNHSPGTTIETFDDATITTIHGYCQQALAQLGLRSGAAVPAVPPRTPSACGSRDIHGHVTLTP